jgi:hypothetical protein
MTVEGDQDGLAQHFVFHFFNSLCDA